MPQPGHKTISVPISSISIGKDANGRAMLDPRRVQELADTLANEPLLHPITLRHKDDSLFLVAGRHRIAAYMKLGRTEIPAIILTLDDHTEATLRLSENLARVQLSPVEQARQLAELVALDDQGVEIVAQRLGRSVDWILDRLEILSWPNDLIEHVHAKRITLTTAKILVRIQPDEIRALRIHDAAAHGCSARTAAYWLQTQHHDLPGHEPPSMFSSQEPIYRTETTVKVICAGCGVLSLFEQTQLVRWCNSCLSLIQRAQSQLHEMSPNLTPPVYDPPPPSASSLHA